MSGYLQRLAGNAMTPARSIHPSVGSIFSPPKDEMPAPLTEFEEIQTVRNRAESVAQLPPAAPRAAHTSALIAAGLPHVSLHGLRRSFGTLCEWVEMPAGISAQIMGHKPSALAEKHYRRRPLDLLRMWHDKIEGWILDQAGISFEAKQSSHPLRAVK